MDSPYRNENSGLALVTGASGGIGLELARLLAAAGYHLTLVARSADKLEMLAASLRGSYHVNVDSIALDLSRVDAVSQLTARVPACDVLVNNAGFANSGRFAALPTEQIREEVQLDVVTLTELTRAYLPGMLQRRNGKVLNVASTAAFLPGPNMAAYYASKAYVLSFSEAIAYELRGTGVMVTCLCPGPTATGFQQRANAESNLLFRLPMAKAADVAKAGFEGMMRGTPVVIPGFANKLIPLFPRIVPRPLLLWVSAKLNESS
jgi:short-subunit dehydrogenase